VKDSDCIYFLQWCLPRLGMRWAGFRKVRGTVCKSVEVIEVVDRWLDPDHRYFKVRGDDKGIYILRYSTSEDAWEMTLFDSGTLGEPRISST